MGSFIPSPDRREAPLGNPTNAVERKSNSKQIDSSQFVLYAYPHGNGWVIYSTIPLSRYLTGFGFPDSLVSTFQDVCAPNVLSYANRLRQGH